MVMIAFELAWNWWHLHLEYRSVGIMKDGYRAYIVEELIP